MSNDKTKWIFDEDAGDRHGGAPGFKESPPPDEPTFRPGDLDDTRMMLPGGSTVFYTSATAGKLGEEHGFEETTDPVVGWLVVVKGRGLGKCISLGAGVNAIGRDPGERAALPFGDNLISGKDHARIFYDDDARAFYIGLGSGKNITRVNGTMLSNPVPLENHALIQLTKVTHLRFVAFCGAEFDWSDLERKDGDAAT
jgi:hypothetical protein